MDRRTPGGRFAFLRAFGFSLNILTMFGLFLVRNGVITGLLYLGVVAAGWFSNEVPSAFLPNEDRGFIRVRCRLPEGQTLARTSEVMDRFHEMALRHRR